MILENASTTRRQIDEALRTARLDRSARLAVEPAADVVGMDEPPASALRASFVPPAPPAAAATPAVAGVPAATAPAPSLMADPEAPTEVAPPDRPAS